MVDEISADTADTEEVIEKADDKSVNITTTIPPIVMVQNWTLEAMQNEINGYVVERDRLNDLIAASEDRIMQAKALGIKPKQEKL
jgi:hypothetical protein